MYEIQGRRCRRDPEVVIASLGDVTVQSSTARVRAAGKFFELDGQRWLLKGLTYGPFAPNSNGEYMPERPRMATDFKQARSLGVNFLRVYHKPTPAMLDLALEFGLRVFVDFPWEKHRCFFEDWTALQDARQRVRTTARELGGRPGLLRSASSMKSPATSSASMATAASADSSKS